MFNLGIENYHPFAKYMHIINRYEFDIYSHNTLLSTKHKVYIKEFEYSQDGFNYDFKMNDIVDTGKINTGYLLQPGCNNSGNQRQIRFYRALGSLFCYLENKWEIISCNDRRLTELKRRKVEQDYDTDENPFLIKR